ncbi:DUF3082 domain-containing protein [Synechocystis sp. PCC 7339]|uniref:DUF3082 domain-containing protein n=1 Tax=unclassified Synechocystis TaxID=2640012 RepID=UPI001BAEF4B2|nr:MULTISPECIES: DUF3082 domain-containing protein [unclassified Synechocystis]QUS60466.1 DUF3082 domain-containing protein [Synechocystis sp. PCC 7338]UAJ72093.1 DUF3082 domain-containing protein [Synechocystis sp. PCC 7339]
MTEPAPKLAKTEPVPPTPLRCLVGSGISASLAWGLYLLTSAIAVSFASKPVLSDKAIVQRIASAVRTLVLGLASMGTFIFAFVAIGLILLMIQLIVQKRPSGNDGGS